MYITSIYNDNILINIKDLYKKITKTFTINDYLIEELNKLYSNKCNSDGLIIKNSIKIINRNTGEFKINSNILYKIIYKCDVLFPNEGCIIENCKIIYSSDILYIGYVIKYNLIIIIPKKFFNNDITIKKNNYINIITLDKYFEINDNYMFIIGIPYNNKNLNDSISYDIENDDNCKNILNEITQFKSEYYDLFYNIKSNEEIKKDIVYDLYDYKEKSLNPILNNLKTDIINFINTNKITNIDINTISNIQDENTLLIIFNTLISNKELNDIYINYKKNFYVNFNQELYITNKNDLNKLHINKTNNINTYINDGNYCYIISTLQMLKNSKLFIKELLTVSIEDEDKIDIINELKILLTTEKNILTDFINLLESYLKKNNINWNIHNMNDINDFIYILFNIIDNTINKKYIKNVYSDIDINYLMIYLT